MEALPKLIAASVAASGHGAAVETVIFRTFDPVTIAATFDRLCREHLGSSITGAISYAASVGCTAGIRLADGRDVVVKTFQPRWSGRFLSAVQRVQAHLAAEEIASYVEQYETARGIRFTRAEQTATAAAALYILAYSARCEHAIDPDGVEYRRAQPRLRTDGERLLDLAGVIDRAR